MPVIKRYSNRKLYDTDSKRYVTLEDLAEFIRQGEDVRVVDHVTGDDLTSVTLLQVIFEEEKKIGGLLPQVFMTRLIRAGGETVSALRSRLTAIDPFQVVDEEIRRRIQALVEQGRISDEEARRFQDLLVRKTSVQGDVVHIPVKGEDSDAKDAGAKDADAKNADAGERVNEPGAVVYPQTIDPEEQPADPREVEALARQVDLLEQELRRLKSASSNEA